MTLVQFFCIQFKEKLHRAYIFWNSEHPHSYSTRFSYFNYVKPIPKLNKCQHGLSYKGQFIWDNVLSTTDKQITNVAKFKPVTKPKLLSLENEVNFFFTSDICTFMHILCTSAKLKYWHYRSWGLMTRPTWSSGHPSNVSLSLHLYVFYISYILAFLIKHILLL